MGFFSRFAGVRKTDSPVSQNSSVFQDCNELRPGSCDLPKALATSASVPGDFIRVPTSPAVQKELVGQIRLQDLVERRIHASQTKGWRLLNLLLCGPDGIGKVTFAETIAERSGLSFQVVNGRDLQKHLDASGLLTNLQENSCLVVDRIDLAAPCLMAMIHEAFMTFNLDLVIGSGPGARVMRIPILPFTFIGTCLASSTLPSSFIDGVTIDSFSEYTLNEFRQILRTLIASKDLNIDEEGLNVVILYAQNNPGRAEMLLSRLVDYTRQDLMSAAEIQLAFDLMGISHFQAQASLTGRLRSMSGVEFEHWTAALFEQLGFDVTTTPVSGDHGIDLVIRRETDQAAVQCKRWTDTIGEPVIREFFGSLMQSGIRRGVIATSSTFSQQARMFCHGKPIELLDLDALVNLFVDGKV